MFQRRYKIYHYDDDNPPEPDWMFHEPEDVDEDWPEYDRSEDEMNGIYNRTDRG